MHRFDGGGKWQGKVGGPESGFFHARGLVVDEEGVVYVADTGTSRVVKYSREGLKTGEIGPQGSGPGEFYGPVGLAIDEDGLFYEADVDNQRLQVLQRERRRNLRNTRKFSTRQGSWRKRREKLWRPMTLRLWVD